MQITKVSNEPLKTGVVFGDIIFQYKDTGGRYMNVVCQRLDQLITEFPLAKVSVDTGYKFDLFSETKQKENLNSVRNKRK